MQVDSLPAKLLGKPSLMLLLLLLLLLSRFSRVRLCATPVGSFSRADRGIGRAAGAPSRAGAQARAAQVCEHDRGVEERQAEETQRD